VTESSAPWVRRCTCGHEEARHEHYREGLDCSVPGCPCLGYWRSWRDVLAEWREKLRRG